MNRLLTPSEVAEILGFSDKTLANLRSRSEGPPYVKLGAAVRYREDELSRWIDARRCPGDGTIASPVDSTRGRRAS